MRLVAVIIMIFLFQRAAAAQTEKYKLNDLYYEVLKYDNSYTFRGSFHVTPNPDCLIHVLYDFEHLVKFVSNVDSIEVIRQGVNWYDVRYTYRRLFFKSTYTYRKFLVQKQHKITFEMIESEQNGLILPKVISSTGYYEIRQEGEGYRVEYFQENRLQSGFLKGIYIQMARKEAKKFLMGLKEYVERTCH